MSKKKEPASACVRKCDKAPKKTSKKTSKRITIPAYLEFIDEALACTADDIRAAEDDQWFMTGVYEGFSAVKRHLHTLSK